MRVRKALLLLVALALIVALVLGAMRLARTGVAAASTETPSTRVRRGTVTIAVTARGDLQGGNPEMLTAPAVAQESLTVTFIRQPGELVKAGDVVVQLDTTQQEYNLREAEADLAEAQQKVIQSEADNQASDEETLYAVEAAKLPVDASAGSGRPRGKIPLVGNFFARHGCGGLRAGLLGDVLIARNTARDQKSARQKQNSINCKAFEHGQRT